MSLHLVESRYRGEHANIDFENHSQQAHSFFAPKCFVWKKEKKMFTIIFSDTEQTHA